MVTSIRNTLPGPVAALKGTGGEPPAFPAGQPGYLRTDSHQPPSRLFPDGPQPASSLTDHNPPISPQGPTPLIPDDAKLRTGALLPQSERSPGFPHGSPLSGNSIRGGASRL